MRIKQNCVSINKMNYKIDPQYEIVNRIINTDGIDDIKANVKAYVIYEVIGYEEASEWKRQEED